MILRKNIDSTCTTAVTPIDNIDDVLKQADALMYRQKLEQHRQKNDF